MTNSLILDGESSDFRGLRTRPDGLEVTFKDVLGLIDTSDRDSGRVVVGVDAVMDAFPFLGVNLTGTVGVPLFLFEVTFGVDLSFTTSFGVVFLFLTLAESFSFSSDGRLAGGVSFDT